MIDARLRTAVPEFDAAAGRVDSETFARALMPASQRCGSALGA